MDEPVDLAASLARLDAPWSPRVVAALNDYRLKLARLEGEFVWHAHGTTDEAFLVVDGELELDLREARGERTVRLAAGSLFVVPRGVEHRPRSTGGCGVLLVEPAGVVNTGDGATGERTAEVDRWLGS